MRLLRTPCFLRAFPSAHWSLPAGMLAAWLFLLLYAPCKEPPFYLETMLATLTVCLCFWASHVRLAPVGNWRSYRAVLVGALHSLLCLVLWLVVMAVPIFILMPAYQCYGPRAKVSELLATTAVLRTEIEERYTRQGSLSGSGKGLELDLRNKAYDGLVTAEGTIIAVRTDVPAVLLLLPAPHDGRIRWECRGYPAKYVPAQCR